MSVLIEIAIHVNCSYQLITALRFAPQCNLDINEQNLLPSGSQIMCLSIVGELMQRQNSGELRKPASSSEQIIEAGYNAGAIMET
jgi:hypothetical protein